MFTCSCLLIHCLWHAKCVAEGSLPSTGRRTAGVHERTCTRAVFTVYPHRLMQQLSQSRCGTTGLRRFRGPQRVRVARSASDDPRNVCTWSRTDPQSDAGTKTHARMETQEQGRTKTRKRTQTRPDVHGHETQTQTKTQTQTTARTQQAHTRANVVSLGLGRSD